MTNGDSDHSKHDAGNGDDTQRLSSGDDATTLPTSSDPAVARQIGPYRLLEHLGEGGMGEVYLAQQNEPIKRRVALKLIKVGMDTKEVIARFESERQALAMMNHPHVARIYDAGSTDTGRPYFVMEHVPGEPITSYCDRHKLNLKSRLELFVPVCQAIHHAHQKGIIHRDIKPSNVLVAVEDGQPVPKVIDFGVAKATQQALTEKTLYTLQGKLIGTPAYMSPEQAEMTGLNVDTTSDVYSLGVLLYELLVGAQPFDAKELREAGIAEIHRIIREVEPPRPSTRISSFGEAATRRAAKRQVEPQRWRKQLHGELDWITMRAMEKDRSRRYQSAYAFAEDVERYLQGEAIAAGPPSQAYKLRKFISRHKGGVAFVATVLILLVGFGASMGVFRGKAEEARDDAEAARDQAQTAQNQAEAVNEFLVDLLESAGPDHAQGRDVSVREILDRTAAELPDRDDLEPSAKVRFLTLTGHVYTSLGLMDEARQVLEVAVELAEREPDLEGRQHAQSLLSLGRLVEFQGELALARSQYERAAEVVAIKMPEDAQARASVLTALANVQSAEGDLEGAVTVYEEALVLIRELKGSDHPQTGMLLGNLANLAEDQGDCDRSIELNNEALQIFEAALGPEHTFVATVLNNVGNCYETVGRLDDAHDAHARSLAIREKVLGPEHPDTAQSLLNLAAIQIARGQLEEARSLVDRGTTATIAVYGKSHAQVVAAQLIAVELAEAQGDMGTAEQHAREAVTTANSLEGHPSEAVAAHTYFIELLLKQGKPQEAMRVAEATLEDLRSSLGPDHYWVALIWVYVAEVRLALGDFEEARTALEAAHGIGYALDEIENPAELARLAREVADAVSRQPE